MIKRTLALTQLGICQIFVKRPLIHIDSKGLSLQHADNLLTFLLHLKKTKCKFAHLFCVNALLADLN